MLERNKQLFKANRVLIVDLSLIFVNVLPAYVLLEVVDQMEGMEAMKHHVKVEKIIDIYESVKAISFD